MSNRELKTRVQMKNDTAEAWQRVSDPSQVTNVFVPLLGEPIFYKTVDGDGFKFTMKIGDGVRTPENLPFFDANAEGGTVDIAVISQNEILEIVGAPTAKLLNDYVETTMLTGEW